MGERADEGFYVPTASKKRSLRRSRKKLRRSRSDSVPADRARARARQRSNRAWSRSFSREAVDDPVEVLSIELFGGVDDVDERRAVDDHGVKAAVGRVPVGWNELALDANAGEAIRRDERDRWSEARVRKLLLR